MSDSNPDERIRARAAARRSAEALADLMLSECTDGANQHPAWKVDYSEAFFDQLRETIDLICPKKAPPPAAPTPKPVGRLPMTSPIEVDERKYYECQIDGYCDRKTPKAVLIVTGEGQQFWLPIKALRCDEPEVMENIGMMELPGWKIIEDDLEDLIA